MCDIELEFEERLFHWCLRDWDRELNSDFQFLRALDKSINARRAVSVMESLEASQLARLTRMLVKRSTTPRGLERCSESLTLMDEQLIEDFQELLEQESWRESMQIPAGGFPKKKGQKRFSRRAFKKAVIAELSDVLGDKYEKCVGSEIIYETPIDQWKLVTFVDFGGRIHNLCYGHNIVNQEGENLIENYSLLRWLGISGGTQWYNLENEDSQQVAETLALLVTHFLNASKELLHCLVDSVH